MQKPVTLIPFESLASEIKGDLFYDKSWCLMYATDASVYREVPSGVCRPADTRDMKKVLAFCREHKLPIIPRTAGTSLAGQVVGHGLVVDFSRYMNQILEFNPEENWIRVQPGVILDELNAFLKPHGLFFGPETSTSNRCMIGGMVANNACGAHSLVYGSTRDHTLEIEALLTDGSEVVFKNLDNTAFRGKCIGNRLENQLYRQIFELLSGSQNQEEIIREYPDPRLHRRNTGYALDLLLDSAVFSETSSKFNFCKMLAGSEGSLAMFTGIKLNLVPLPPPETALVCVHLHSIEEALQANLIALKHGPVAVELIDKVVLDCTKTNIHQRKNRFFIKGEPGAILVVEFAFETREEISKAAAGMESQMRNKNLGFHFPLLFKEDVNKVWALRKAGLGLLSNVPGDAKPIAVIEDAAVHVEQLPEFIREVKQMLVNLGLECVYYAHIGTGELHLRPLLNLKNPADVEKFYQVAREMAFLVKQYRGSLSGEHGDGRLRGEFIPLMLGENNYELLRKIKETWDPDNLMNPGKIISTPSMKTFLRYPPEKGPRKLKTFFYYPESSGFLRGVEKCNGSGDCRKPVSIGGVMCPSYHATLNESDTTRGRANILREFVTHSDKKNPFNHPEILQVLDLCLSCKGCKAECPSNVDMGKYKAEALQQYYLENGTPIRARLIGAFGQLNRIGSLTPALFNFMAGNPVISKLIKKSMGFASERKLPLLQKQTLRRWYNKNRQTPDNPAGKNSMVYLFCDEFINYNDTITGIRTILLLNRIGYKVAILNHEESGRTYLSKGLLKRAKSIAAKNITLFSEKVSKENPLIGIEPSAILTFRDEYPDLAEEEMRKKALGLAENTFTIEEFICREYAHGNIDPALFSDAEKSILLHGHCHQKALSSMDYSSRMLSIPKHFKVQTIDCGCCGMAGSFGFEKDHYKLSMEIGEMKLLPAVREAAKDTIISATGTSCRQQIYDGTGRKALHPADILFLSLKSNEPVY